MATKGVQMKFWGVQSATFEEIPMKMKELCN